MVALEAMQQAEERGLTIRWQAIRLQAGLAVAVAVAVLMAVLGAVAQMYTALSPPIAIQRVLPVHSPEGRLQVEGAAFMGVQTEHTLIALVVRLAAHMVGEEVVGLITSTPVLGLAATAA